MAAKKGPAESNPSGDRAGSGRGREAAEKDTLPRSVRVEQFSREELQFQLLRRALCPATSDEMGWTEPEVVTVEQLEAELAEMAPEPPRVVTVGQLAATLAEMAPETPRVVTGEQLAATFAEMALDNAEQPHPGTDGDAAPSPPQSNRIAPEPLQTCV